MFLSFFELFDVLTNELFLTLDMNFSGEIKVKHLFSDTSWCKVLLEMENTSLCFIEINKYNI